MSSTTYKDFNRILESYIEGLSVPRDVITKEEPTVYTKELSCWLSKEPYLLVSRFHFIGDIS